MTAKKIGKAVLDPEKEMWKVGVSPERFMINRRLVDTKPDVKAARHVYSKASSRHTPARRKTEKRKEYMTEVNALRRDYEEAIVTAFEDIRKESFTYPIPLRLARDYDHKGDWRYCMYEGIIYLFDRPDQSDEEMLRQIKDLEPKAKGEINESA